MSWSRGRDPARRQAGSRIRVRVFNSLLVAVMHMAPVPCRFWIRGRSGRKSANLRVQNFRSINSDRPTRLCPTMHDEALSDVGAEYDACIQAHTASARLARKYLEIHGGAWTRIGISLCGFCGVSCHFGSIRLVAAF